MSPSQPSHEQLIAYAAGDLPAGEALNVEAWLAQDAAARATVAVFRRVRQLLAEDDSIEPSQAAVRRARAVFRPATATRTLGWLEAVDRFIAQLMYDSRVTPAFTRSSATLDRLDLTYQTDAGDIDLQAELIVGEDDSSDASLRRWLIMGQIAESAIPSGKMPPREIALTTIGTRDCVIETKCDEHGVFRMTVEAGQYDLHIRMDSRVVVLPAIDLS